MKNGIRSAENTGGLATVSQVRFRSLERELHKPSLGRRSELIIIQ